MDIIIIGYYIIIIYYIIMDIIIRCNTELIPSYAKFTYQAAVTFSILQMVKLRLREATSQHTINKR